LASSLIAYQCAQKASAIVDVGVGVGVVPGTEVLLEASSSVTSFVDEGVADLSSDIASLNSN